MKRKLLALLAVASCTVSSQALAYTYVWTVDKSVDKPELTLAWGQSATVTWTVAWEFTITGYPTTGGDDVDRCITASDPRFEYEELLCGTPMEQVFTEKFGPYTGNAYWEDVIYNDAYFRTSSNNTGHDYATVTLRVGGTPVPEPGTFALLGLGLACLSLSRWLKAKEAC